MYRDTCLEGDRGVNIRLFVGGKFYPQNADIEIKKYVLFGRKNRRWPLNCYDQGTIQRQIRGRGICTEVGWGWRIFVLQSGFIFIRLCGFTKRGRVGNRMI